MVESSLLFIGNEELVFILCTMVSGLIGWLESSKCVYHQESTLCQSEEDGGVVGLVSVD